MTKKKTQVAVPTSKVEASEDTGEAKEKSMVEFKALEPTDGPEDGTDTEEAPESASEAEPGQEPVAGPVPEVKQEPEPSATKPIPVAVPTNGMEGFVTIRAKKTTVKMIGKWYSLTQGKLLTVPKAVAEALRRSGDAE